MKSTKPYLDQPCKTRVVEQMKIHEKLSIKWLSSFYNICKFETFDVCQIWEFLPKKKFYGLNFIKLILFFPSAGLTNYKNKINENYVPKQRCIFLFLINLVHAPRSEMEKKQNLDIRYLKSMSHKTCPNMIKLSQKCLKTEKYVLLALKDVSGQK